MNRASSRKRSAFSLAETTVALILIAVLGVIVAECVVWSLRARAKLATQQVALELAANLLETGAAQPWDKLDQAWAESLTIPTEMSALLPQGKLEVTLEPEKLAPQTRRLTAKVLWKAEPDRPMQSVSLSTLLSARTLRKEGASP